jgi:hypothetical protein
MSHCSLSTKQIEERSQRLYTRMLNALIESEEHHAQVTLVVLLDLMQQTIAQGPGEEISRVWAQETWEGLNKLIAGQTCKAVQ